MVKNVGLLSYHRSIIVQVDGEVIERRAGIDWD